MNKEQKFFICKHCGNLVGATFGSGAPMVCCGEEMTRLAANTTDTATEKHAPVVTVEGNTVTAVTGSVGHPMLPEHYIQRIYLLITTGGHHTTLQPGEAPKAVFTLQDNGKPVAVYKHCNLHGLWKTELQFILCTLIYFESQQKKVLERARFPGRAFSTAAVKDTLLS